MGGPGGDGDLRRMTGGLDDHGSGLKDGPPEGSHRARRHRSGAVLTPAEGSA